MNIAVVIPISGRLELAKRVVLYYETLRVGGVEITVVPVVDTSEEFKEFGASCAWAPLTLGGKFNLGISSCKKYYDKEFDGVMIVGSDDLISPYIFRELCDKEPLYMEIGGCHFFESATGRMIYEHRFNCGAGKYFSRALLDACDWSPYDPDMNRNVDTSPRKHLPPNGRTIWQSSKKEPFCIDIKSKEGNMWGFGIGLDAPQELTASETATCFSKMNNERPEWWMGV